MGISKVLSTNVGETASTPMPSKRNVRAPIGTSRSSALKAIMNAHGRTPRGVNPAELAMSGPDYAEELRKRGFDLTVTYLD